MRCQSLRNLIVMPAAHEKKLALNERHFTTPHLHLSIFKNGFAMVSLAHPELSLGPNLEFI